MDINPTAEDRSYMTVGMDEINLIDFSQVLQNSEETVRENNNKIYTLNSTITEFSNGLGLNGEEIKKLSDRIQSDLVLALALGHHLHISSYLSFFQIAEQLSNLSKKYVLIEFIPDTDQKITILLDSKMKKLNNYNELEFEKEFNLKFKILEKKNILGSKRKIYLFEKI